MSLTIKDIHNMKPEEAYFEGFKEGRETGRDEALKDVLSLPRLMVNKREVIETESIELMRASKEDKDDRNM